MDPPGTWMAGRLSLAMAIKWAGMDLSEAETTTTPSQGHTEPWSSSHVGHGVPGS